MKRYGLGYIPDPIDERDFLLKNFLPKAVELPEKFSLRPKMTPVKSQGTLGSCVAFGTTAMKEYFDKLEYGKDVDLSEQFLYGECKKIDGCPNIEGTTAKAAVTTLKNKGICEESYFSYEGKYPPQNSPRSGYLDNASVYKISTYAAVSGTIPGIKQALYQNGPVSLAVMVYTSFYNATNNHGIIPAPSGNQEGGHLMCIVGWDDTKQFGNFRGCLELKNSWGTGFGDRGYVWLPYDVYNTIQLGSRWSIVDIIGIVKHWSDWPNQNLTEQDLVYQRKIFQGYPDGTMKPWNNMLRRHVALVMQRLNQNISKNLLDDYTEATRGWVRDMFPFLEWNEERWDESITRFQFILLLARYLATC